MKRILWAWFLCAIVFLPLVSSADVYVLARFNMPEQAGRDVYLPGGTGDILTSVTLFQRAWPAGVTQPQLVAPDIAVPPAGGFDGGNALKGNPDQVSTTRQGYYVQIQPPITADFTAEVVFRLFNLNPTYSEYKIENILSTWWPAGSTPDNSNMKWELRFFGSAGGLGYTNQIQLMTFDGSTEHNVISGVDAIAVDTWYHAAAVYNNSSGQITFYLNGSSVGTASPAWPTTSPGGHPHKMACIILAAWPNDAGTCRDMAGYMDAFALSNEMLGPGSFVLGLAPPTPTPTPTPTPIGFADVTNEWMLYE